MEVTLCGLFQRNILVICQNITYSTKVVVYKGYFLKIPLVGAACVCDPWSHMTSWIVQTRSWRHADETALSLLNSHRVTSSISLYHMFLILFGPLNNRWQMVSSKLHLAYQPCTGDTLVGEKSKWLSESSGSKALLVLPGTSHSSYVIKERFRPATTGECN